MVIKLKLSLYYNYINLIELTLRRRSVLHWLSYEEYKMFHLRFSANHQIAERQALNLFRLPAHHSAKAIILNPGRT